MQTAAYAQYRAITTETAGPGDLLLQLYQAAIKNVGQARLAVECANVPTAHKHIVRAQDIVLELQRTLDHEKGGELAPTLDSLYTFMRRRLVDANIAKAVEPLDEVQGLLRQLLAAWQVAVRETRR
ncbi:MAG TPA: flagellar export chaperone FliS [Chloroflexota bacterium]|jgi:flagellar protein FliS